MLPENVKLGVVAAALSPDPRVAPGLARTAGFRGLQFEARSSAVDVAELSGTGRREFLHLLSARNQELVGLRHDLGTKGLGPGADVDRELARLARVMEAATGLGAPLVCVDLGPLPEPQAAPEPPKPKVTQEMAGLILLPGASDVRAAKSQAAARPSAAQAPDPAFVSQVDAAMVELGRFADRTSTVIAFRSELSSLAALERALRAADCPWFGVDLDPAAVLADAWDLDEMFSRLGAMIRHVRGRDAVGGTGARTKPAAIGRGGTDWAHLLSNLNGADYAGWITVDPVELPDRQAAAAEAVRYLKSLP
jgi:sugar phosphate isomerase/epimerase